MSNSPQRVACKNRSIDSGSAIARSRANASGLTRYSETSLPLLISVSNLEMTRGLQDRAYSISVILLSSSRSWICDIAG